MKLHRLTLALLAVTLAGSGRSASAQPSPTDMRSGSETHAGSGNYTLFTVPAGRTFVLTDFTWTSFPFYPVTGMGSLISVNNLSGPRWAWWAFDNSASTSATDHENPVGAHWTTGLVFNSNENLIVSVGPQAMPPNVMWTASWSGYLAPLSSSSVEDPSTLESRPGLAASPNPSRHRVSFDFDLKESGDVLLAIFDVQGNEVRTLVTGEMPAGKYSIPWDGRDDKGGSVGDGVYFARLRTPRSNEVRKLTRIHTE